MRKYTANQDIRDYMADHNVGQIALAKQMGVATSTVCLLLKKELPQAKKDELLNHIDAIVAARNPVTEEEQPSNEPDETEDSVEETTDISVSCKFQVGDRVKIPSNTLCIGIVCDIWHSMVQDKLMYAVELEGGNRGLYTEAQLEPAPLPITYTFEAHIDGNVAVCVMNAAQGDKTWIYARGHAHIIHDGEVGMAQAISYAARRMFESLDSKQKDKIYVKQ